MDAEVQPADPDNMKEQVVIGIENQEENSTYTVDEALVKMGFGKFQACVLAYAGMGWISEAMEMMLLSFVGPAVQSLWGLSAKQESLITTAVFVGMLVGTYSWGIMSDNYGRRKGFLVTAVVTFVAGFLSAFAPNYYFLIIFLSLFGWSWFGRRSCALILVSRVYSCSKQRRLDGYFFSFLECWDSLGGGTCVGMPVIS
ncbi:hypothetical protein Patl1_30960 [Pistacia atlantica]|uniref:Uncharacterized protein n=1 Tax=Pistacia atlantica TaxID=434234 RepID=A0ACC1AAK3_9ROSI|nr:hypothetical protein Patl1_30960 [Pistacia atlantica]